jgi:hypothetical protein
MWDNTSPWSSRAFLILKIACVVGIAGLVMALVVR